MQDAESQDLQHRLEEERARTDELRETVQQWEKKVRSPSSLLLAACRLYYAALAA